MHVRQFPLRSVTCEKIKCEWKGVEGGLLILRGSDVQPMRHQHPSLFFGGVIQSDSARDELRRTS